MINLITVEIFKIQQGFFHLLFCQCLYCNLKKTYFDQLVTFHMSSNVLLYLNSESEVDQRWISL